MAPSSGPHAGPSAGPAAVNMQEMVRLKNQIRRLVNNELRAICRSHFLPVYGTKAVLQNRIFGYIDQLIDRGDTLNLEALRYRANNNARSPPPEFVTQLAGQAAGTGTGTTTAAAVAAPRAGNFPPPPSPPPPPSQGPLLQPLLRLFGRGTTSRPDPVPASACPCDVNPAHVVSTAMDGALVYKQTPFYTARLSLSPCISLRPMSSAHARAPEHVITIALSFDTATAHAIKSNSGRVMLFSARDPVAHKECNLAYPSSTAVAVNGQRVSGDFRGIKGKAESVMPLDLTDSLDLSRHGRHNIDVTYTPSTSSKFYLRLYLVDRHSPTELAEKLKDKPLISRESVINEIKSKHNDPDITTTHINISLRDPLTLTRMTLPCRGLNCLHFQCFDGLTYLSLQEQGPTWSCPLCFNTVRYENLAIDGYMFEILKESPSTCESITVQPDGTWSLPKVAAIDVLEDSSDEEDGAGNGSDVIEVDSNTPGSNVTPRPSVSVPPVAGQKRTRDVIDLTLSDDEDDDDDDNDNDGNGGGRLGRSIAPPPAQRLRVAGPDHKQSGSMSSFSHVGVPPPFPAAAASSTISTSGTSWNPPSTLSSALPFPSALRAGGGASGGGGNVSAPSTGHVSTSASALNQTAAATAATTTAAAQQSAPAAAVPVWPPALSQPPSVSLPPQPSLPSLSAANVLAPHFASTAATSTAQEPNNRSNDRDRHAASCTAGSSASASVNGGFGAFGAGGFGTSSAAPSTATATATSAATMGLPSERIGALNQGRQNLSDAAGPTASGSSIHHQPGANLMGSFLTAFTPPSSSSTSTSRMGSTLGPALSAQGGPTPMSPYPSTTGSGFGLGSTPGSSSISATGPSLTPGAASVSTPRLGVPSFPSTMATPSRPLGQNQAPASSPRRANAVSGGLLIPTLSACSPPPPPPSAPASSASSSPFAARALLPASPPYILHHHENSRPHRPPPGPPPTVPDAHQMYLRAQARAIRRLQSLHQQQQQQQQSQQPQHKVQNAQSQQQLQQQKLHLQQQQQQQMIQIQHQQQRALQLPPLRQQPHFPSQSLPPTPFAATHRNAMSSPTRPGSGAQSHLGPSASVAVNSGAGSSNAQFNVNSSPHLGAASGAGLMSPTVRAVGPFDAFSGPATGSTAIPPTTATTSESNPGDLLSGPGAGSSGMSRPVLHSAPSSTSIPPAAPAPPTPTPTSVPTAVSAPVSGPGLSALSFPSTQLATHRPAFGPTSAAPSGPTAGQGAATPPIPAPAPALARAQAQTQAQAQAQASAPGISQVAKGSATAAMTAASGMGMNSLGSATPSATAATATGPGPGPGQGPASGFKPNAPFPSSLPSSFQSSSLNASLPSSLSTSLSSTSLPSSSLSTAFPSSHKSAPVGTHAGIVAKPGQTHVQAQNSAPLPPPLSSLPVLPHGSSGQASLSAPGTSAPTPTSTVGLFPSACIRSVLGTGSTNKASGVASGSDFQTGAGVGPGLGENSASAAVALNSASNLESASASGTTRTS